MLLTGPLQSWGVRSKFNKRDTYPYPTRSGIWGLLASACGIGRDEPLPAQLHEAELLVRRDRRGRLLTDFHTVGANLPPEQQMVTADHKRRANPITTERDYLSDAAFTAILAAPSTVIDQLSGALRAPRWAPYLGRRGCPPSLPVLVGTSTRPPQQLAEELPLYGRAPRRGGDIKVSALWDGFGHDDGQPDLHIHDVPVERAPDRRTFQTRPAVELSWTRPANACAGTGLTAFRAMTRSLEEER
ncbi:hypothetical protein GCM10009799_14340 [Nocardiopsis rhodophaea]|uniref:Type I-E CRISPR-associated protein Cas5/CasD n=2 Tax=Nocardiopsis rhodophaea TaxID=280238 RepID=A0ABN2SNB0_9ACTN